MSNLEYLKQKALVRFLSDGVLHNFADIEYYRSNVDNVVEFVIQEYKQKLKTELIASDVSFKDISKINEVLDKVDANF